MIEHGHFELDISPATLLHLAPAEFARMDIVRVKSHVAMGLQEPAVIERAVKNPAAHHSVGYSSLKFNVKAQRYFVPKGKTAGGSNKAGAFLSPKAVRDAISADIAHEEEAMAEMLKPLREMAQQRLNGRIDQRQWGEAVTQWRNQMALHVKNIHLNQLAAARGGFHEMSPASYGRAGWFLRYHYGKLNAFASDIYDDPAIVVDQSPGRMPMAQRVGLYAKTALFTFEAERVVANFEQGKTKKRNVPHSKESCVGCVAQTVLGWIDILRGIPIGKRVPCGPGDLCTWEFG